MPTFPAVCPLATPRWLPSGARPDGQTYYGGPLTRSRGVVFHVNAGDGDPYNWWTDPANPSVASAHLQIMATGELVQYVRLDTVAWAQGAGNSDWHSVETQGWPDKPLTGPQFETFARLLAWGHGAWGWPLQVTDTPAGTGLGTHAMGGMAWGGHACPGTIRAAQRPALLDRARQLLNPTPTPAAGRPHVLEDDMPTVLQAAGRPPILVVGTLFVELRTPAEQTNALHAYNTGITAPDVNGVPTAVWVEPGTLNDLIAQSQRQVRGGTP